MMNLAVKMPVFETRALPFSEMSERELGEQRNNLIDEMESLISKGKKERRSLNGREENRFSACKNDIQEIDRLLQAKKLDFSSLGTSKIENRALFNEQAKDLMDYLVKGELRNLTAGESGGAVVPTEIAKFVVDKIVNTSPILKLANTITTNADISVPVFDYTQLGVGYITENTELVEASQDYDSVKLTNFIIAGLVKCSRSLVSRADFPVLEYLLGSLAKRIGLFLEKQLIIGTGTSQLRGLTTLPAGQTMTAGATGAISGDEIIELMAMLPSTHAENGIFITHPTTWADIQKLKSGNGEYLFSVGQFGQDMGKTLLGRPLYVSDSVPVNAVGNKFLYYLDPQALTVKMTEQVGVQVLDQTFASSYNFGLLGYVECDSAITSTQGVSALVGA